MENCLAQSQEAWRIPVFPIICSQLPRGEYVSRDGKQQHSPERADEAKLSKLIFQIKRMRLSCSRQWTLRLLRIQVLRSLGVHCLDAETRKNHNSQKVLEAQFQIQIVDSRRNVFGCRVTALWVNQRSNICMWSGFSLYQLWLIKVAATAVTYWEHLLLVTVGNWLEIGRREPGTGILSVNIKIILTITYTMQHQSNSFIYAAFSFTFYCAMYVFCHSQGEVGGGRWDAAASFTPIVTVALLES